MKPFIESANASSTYKVASNVFVQSAYWSSDGQTIVYGEWPQGMFTVPARGGSPTRILEHGHLEHPSFLDLSNGRRAYLDQAEDADRPGGHGIYVQLVGENQRRFLTMSASTNP